MYECIRELKPSGTHCSAVSNGILATNEVIHDLVAAGLDGIQFSLDGLEASHDKLRNRAGTFSSVINAINYVINETNLRLSIAFTPTSFNIDDFSEVYALLAEIFEKSKRKDTKDYIDLRLQPLMLLGRAKCNQNIIPSEDQYRKLVYLINKYNTSSLKHSCIDIKWGDPIDHLIRFRNTNFFLDQTTVHANGDIVVSAYLPLVVGNVKKHSLLEYWEHGLREVWSTNIVQYLTSRMQSIYDMEQVTNTIADINMDNGLYLDLMECDLNDLNLIKEVILEH